MIKQVSIFGFSLAFIAILFSFYAAWHAGTELNLLTSALNSFVIAVIASAGFAIGCKITNFNFQLKQLAMAALCTFLFNHSLQNILNMANKPLLVKMLVVFAVALIFSWRLPTMFRKSPANK